MFCALQSLQCPAPATGRAGGGLHEGLAQHGFLGVIVLNKKYSGMSLSRMHLANPKVVWGVEGLTCV